MLLSKSPERYVVDAQPAIGVDVGRVQGERALEFRDGFFGATPIPEGSSPFWPRAPTKSGSRASAFDANSSARSKSPLGSPETPSTAGMKNFHPISVRARTLLGSMASACSHRAGDCCIRLFADKSALPKPRCALKRQVLGVAIGRRRPFETGALGLGELKVECVREMRDDRVLRLQ